ncbi:DUF3307 domain-containing protein [Neorhodopirellula lusitana]|uniref:DUF3307 domain-containing protein n=1 Tax=Neorhodopirellula lusitana TaxID=445327 RepID=UPI00385009E1
MPFAETAAALLAAHLLGDFVFQPDSLVKAKGRNWWGLPIHVAIVLAISTLLLGNFRWEMFAVIGVSHLILDAIKVFALPRVMSNHEGPWPFSIDQFAHFAFIIVVSAIWPSLFADGLWEKYLPVTPDFDASNWYMGVLVLISGFILAVPVGGILVGKITNGMIDDDDDDEADEEEHEDDDEEEDDIVAPPAADDVDATANAIEKAATAIETAAAAYTNSLCVDSSSSTTDESLSEQDEAKIEHILRGLPDGGRYIGWLERILVLLFVLSGYPQGIGFLIAAKSILRFGDIKNWHQRAATEYVIIGTFLSFAWAMVIAGLTQQALQVWFPPKPPAATVIELTSDSAAQITAATTSDGATAPGTSTAAAPAPAATPDTASSTGADAPDADAAAATDSADAAPDAVDDDANNSKTP